MSWIRRLSAVGFVSALSLLLSAAPSAQQKGAPGDSFVATITQGNFDQHVPSRGAGVFVNFYMPWCKYSKKLTLDYELLGHAFQRVRDVTVGRVNCEQDKPICERFDVKGYPTLMWFPRESSEGVDYKGGRTSQEMIQYVNEQAGIKARPKRRPNQITALTADSFKAAVEDKATDSVVQFLLPGDEVCRHFETDFEMLATALAAETHVTFSTLDAAAFPDLAKQEGVKSFPMVKVYRRENRGVKSYAGKYAAVSMLPWMNELADTSRMLSGVTNSTVGRVPGLDALVDRMARSSPSLWPAQTQEIHKEVLRLEGPERSYGDMYLEAISDLTSEGGFDLMTSKRLEINERMVLEKDPAVRAELHAQRNVIAGVQGKAERHGMLKILQEQQQQQKRAPSSTSTSSSSSASSGGAGDADKAAASEPVAEAAESRSSSKPLPPKKKIKRRSKSDREDTAPRDEL